MVDLLELRNFDMRIDNKFEQLMRLRAMAEKRTSVLSPVRGSGHSVNDPMRPMDVLIDLEKSLDGMIDEFVDLKRRAGEAINAMPDQTERNILEMRYIKGISWWHIARILELPESTVRGSLHRRAMKNYTIYGVDA